MLPRYHRIPDADLDEFIAIYKEEFGDEINRADASETASRLVMLYALLSRRVPETPAAPMSVTRLAENRPDDRPPTLPPDFSPRPLAFCVINRLLQFEQHVLDPVHRCFECCKSAVGVPGHRDQGAQETNEIFPADMNRYALHAPSLDVRGTSTKARDSARTDTATGLAERDVVGDHLGHEQ